jgi:hypothetical protein
MDRLRSAAALLVVPLCASFLVGVGPVALAAVSARPGLLAARIPAVPVTPGAKLWVARYNGSGNGDDEAFSLGLSPDGTRVFVTGASTGSTSSGDYVTVAYNVSTGAKLWVARYNGPGNDNDEAHSLGVSPDGTRVFVTGYSTGSTSCCADYATVAYNASTGARLWVARYHGPGNGAFAKALGVSPDGTKVFVTGYSYGSTGYYDYATIAYNASTGTKLWLARYNGPINRNNAASALGVSPDGTRVFVTGYSTGSAGYFNYATVAYNASTGAKLWVARYSYNGGDDQASSLGVSPDGTRVFVTGASFRSTICCEYFDYATVAYNASTGAKLWVARYHGPGYGDNAASALGVSPDGTRVIVTGKSPGSTGYTEYATIAYNASTGAKLWVARYHGPGNGAFAQALSVSPDGTRVFVAGYSTGSTGSFDYATIAYNASTGAKLWVARYNGPGSGDDKASSLRVSPDGTKVFVTGASTGSTSSGDYATVTYSVT